MAAILNDKEQSSEKDSGGGNNNGSDEKSVNEQTLDEQNQLYQITDIHTIRNFRSVTTKLLILILLFTLIATLISTSMQVYDEYKRNIKLVDEEMDQIKNSYLQPLAITVWDVDRERLAIQLQGILSLPDVEEVRFENKAEIGEELVFGKVISNDIYNKKFSVIYINTSMKKEVNNLGKLSVTVGLDKLKFRMINMGIRILCVEAIKIFLVTLFIFMVFQLLVAKHLKKIAEYTQGLIGLESLKSKLVLDRDDSIVDEFTLMVDSTNKVTDRLYDHAINLHTMINDKTKDIKSILDNIQQGIFTILPNNKIHSEYSKYLENIFETENIAGQDVIDTLFKNSDLGPETLSKIFSVLIASLGEGINSFENSKEHLVREFKKGMKDGTTKILELDWHPILNKNEIIEKIMVTVRNVTDIRNLQVEAQKKQRELEIIAEILSITPEKFNNFLNIFKQLITENRKLLKTFDYQMVEDGDKNNGGNSESNLNFINIILSNLHTLKSAARSHGLFGLSAVTHDIEHTITEFKNDHIKNKIKKIDSLVLLKQHKKLQIIVEDYIEINDKKLGRHSAGLYNSSSNKHVVAVEYRDIQSSMELLRQLNFKNLLPEQRLQLHKIYKFWALVGTSKLKNVLTTPLSHVPELAKELGKTVPKLYINDKGIYIRSQIHTPLQNIFAHLFRNSIDHGIERASERLAKGKEAFGLLEFNLHVGKFHFMIRYKDDGKGLNVDNIRKLASEKDIISSEDQLNKDEIANLIFDSRFSTATTVTEISGRGMGLDAVKKIIEDINGDIKVQLINAPMKDEGYFAFEFIITLPRDVVVLKEEIEKMEGHQSNKLVVIEDKDKVDKIDRADKEANG
ncbi:MAG: hypothetical protein HQK51_17410 [Oligoflexia bacterium]|nr:hypothetical protein [Oligoflexia bacterium]